MYFGIIKWLKKQATERSRELIGDEDFKGRHRARQKDFTRVLSLPFALFLVLMMRKSVKSLQNVVNEAMTWLNEPLVTASATSQARYIPRLLK